MAGGCEVAGGNLSESWWANGLGEAGVVRLFENEIGAVTLKWR